MISVTMSNFYMISVAKSNFYAQNLAYAVEQFLGQNDVLSNKNEWLTAHCKRLSRFLSCNIKNGGAASKTL